MYNIIKLVIQSKQYDLTDILHKIDTFWVQSSITDEQKEELETLARENADPENSYAPIQEQINALANTVSSLKDRVKALESANASEEPDDEYLPYVQPTGAHDAYNIGNKILWTDGNKYVCQMDGCVWDPDTYPKAWQLVTDNEDSSATENQEEHYE